MRGVARQAGDAKNRDPGGVRPLSQRGHRYPLLLQQQLRAMLFWPALLIALLATLLIALSPAAITPYRPALAAVGICGWFMAALTLWFSLRAFVCCRADGLWLHLPFYQLIIPYRNIESTRLAQFGRQFPPENEPWSRRRFLEPLFPSTVVVVELHALPVSRRELTLWMSRYLLSADTPGFVLPVQDWLGFRGELDEFRSRDHWQRVAAT